LPHTALVLLWHPHHAGLLLRERHVEAAAALHARHGCSLRLRLRVCQSSLLLPLKALRHHARHAAHTHALLRKEGHHSCAARARQSGAACSAVSCMCARARKPKPSLGDDAAAGRWTDNRSAARTVHLRREALHAGRTAQPRVKRVIRHRGRTQC
jgi:hypothetical protein